eukprot:PLAT14684.2.p1 GENE.PLAT14684.2~~PLAT14684.2.p1  ORF type:complete len:413 (-),score=131.49 PLAT14684.2:124-1362(-)
MRAHSARSGCPFFRFLMDRRISPAGGVADSSGDVLFGGDRRITPVGTLGDGEHTTLHVLDVEDDLTPLAAVKAGKRSSKADQIAAGREALVKLSRDWAQKRLKLFILSRIARVCFAVAGIPLLWQYSSDDNSWIPFAAWCAWDIALFLSETSMYFSRTHVALQSQSESDACCLAVLKVMAEEEKVYLALVPQVIIALLLYIFFITLDPTVPLAIGCTGAVMFFITFLVVPMVKTFALGPRVANRMVLVDTRDLLQMVESHAPLGDVRDKLQRVGKLYTASRGAAIGSVVEMIVFVISTACLLLPFISFRPNGCMIILGVLTALAIFTTKLPAASSMSLLLTLPARFAQVYCLQPGNSVEEEQAYTRFLLHTQAAKLGWYVGDVALTSALLTRMRTFLIPAISLLAREIVLRG